MLQIRELLLPRDDAIGWGRIEKGVTLGHMINDVCMRVRRLVDEAKRVHSQISCCGNIGSGGSGICDWRLMHSELGKVGDRKALSARALSSRVFLNW